MTIFIVDLDWMADKTEIPNINCMRLSSFHKQKGDSVYLISELNELKMYYDRLYVSGESDDLPPISHTILNDKRTILLGKRFQLCGAKQPGAIIAGCRPDYLLYDTYGSKNSYAKANFVTFYTSGGEKVQNRQPWKNRKNGLKRTIVTDDNLWTQDSTEITLCLSELIDEPNIVFLHPISLKCLIENPSVKNVFCSLNFSRGTEFKWRNDIGHDSKSAETIVNFLLELKQHTYSVVGTVPFRAQLSNNWQEDLKRILKIAYIFKTNKLRCFLPENINTHIVYKWLQTWLNTKAEISWIEFLTFFKFAQKGTRWYNIINDPTQWGDYKIKFLVKLLSDKQWQILLPLMSIQWGRQNIDYSCINLQLIEKEASKLL